MLLNSTRTTTLHLLIHGSALQRLYSFLSVVNYDDRSLKTIFLQQICVCLSLLSHTRLFKGHTFLIYNHKL